jgi:aerobic carbon-monoxide dehydrogenase large subunit
MKGEEHCMVISNSGPRWTRIEDERLLRGEGAFTGDLSVSNAGFGVVLRSVHAAADILSIETGEALRSPGVLAVYTAADLAANKIGGLPCIGAIENRDGSPAYLPPRPVLADGVVRHAGEPVAFVVGTDRISAEAAAATIQVNYRSKSTVVDPESALEPGAPAVWAEAAGNCAFDWQTGHEDETNALFASAAHVTRLRVVNNRLAAAPIELRSACAEYDPASDSLMLRTSTQGSWLVRDLIASVLKMQPSRMRVVTQDVGGSFGSKIYPYPEHVLVCLAAKKLKRPVCWTADRSEAFLADVHGRDTISVAELALDGEHNFLALRVRVVANMGAYLSTFASLVPTVIGTAVLPSVYAFRSVFATVRGALTNTVPVDAYRGAGMPETIYLVERLIDTAAAELALDRVELRRRNLIRADAMPCAAALGSVYDSGDFPWLLDSAIERSDWSGFPERRRTSAARGRRRGIGLACYLATTGGPPEENTEIRFADGRVVLSVGTQSSGQGHETAFALLLAERLGIPVNCVVFTQGDTELLPAGGGTGGTRSLYAQGAAIVEAASRIIEKGRSLAAEALQASVDEVEFDAGHFGVVGTGRRINLLTLASLQEDAESATSRLNTKVTAKSDIPTFPNGCHVAEVEVDPETGSVKLLRYVATDDVGRVLDKRLARGQVHGGVAQGFGQATCELVHYDRETGQLLAGSFLDYALPRADDLPEFDVEFTEIPCTTNPLGTKGVGEVGAIASPPAIVNAVLDALAEDRVRNLDMPITAEQIWKALQKVHGTATLDVDGRK